MYRIRKYQLLSIILIVSCIFSIMMSLQLMKVSDAEQAYTKIITNNFNPDDATGCEMPKLDPFSQEAMQFVEKRDKIVCDGFDWVTCVESKCFVVDEILKTMKDVVCFYKDILYIDDNHYEIGPSVRVHADHSYWLNKSDHVKVSCSGTPVDGFGIFSSRWFGFKAGFRHIETRPPSSRSDALKVLVLAIDSVSRNAFIRLMPHSYRFLKDELQATILKSYNIVGDGTARALFPILTGKKEEEQPDASKTNGNHQFVNESLFIFHDLKANGYHTAFFEDSPWIGTFQLYYNGFQRQPADHYMRPFFMEESKNGVKWWSGMRNRYCSGAMPQYAYMLDLTNQFMRMDGQRFCFTFIVDISHDDLYMLTTADDDVAQFLRAFKDDGLTEDTVLIVMGDHGTRYGGPRQTPQGTLEERMPLVAILLPEKLKRSRPDAQVNLMANADVLTTPLDLYSTLMDVTGLELPHENYKVPGTDLPRSMSILKPIPKRRSCRDADVAPYWCACTKWSDVSNKDPMFQRVGAMLAEFVNNRTNEQRSQCVLRTLLSTEWVRYDGYSDSFQNHPRWSLPIEHYQTKIVMEPGRAVFEGSVTHHVKENYFSISPQDVSRTSAYANESVCVTSSHPHLLKYCYCKDNDVTIKD